MVGNLLLGRVVMGMINIPQHRGRNKYIGHTVNN